MSFLRGVAVGAAFCALGSLTAVAEAQQVVAPDWDLLPVLDTRQVRQFSSYDRSELFSCIAIDPGNKDFNNFLGTRGAVNRTTCERSDGVVVEPSLGTGHLIAASDSGPGVVSRIFLTAATLGNTVAPGFLNETIRIYADDLTTPVYQGKVADLGVGLTAPFDWPMTGAPNGAVVSYVPIAYKSKLRVMLGGLQGLVSAYYYNVNVVEGLPGGAPMPEHFAAQKPSDFRALDTFIALGSQASSAPGQASWVQQRNVLLSPGQTVRLLDKTGPATLRTVQLFLPGTDVAHLADLKLRVTWDSAQAPAIDTDLATLFGQGGGLGGLSTVPMNVAVNGDYVTLTLSLPMPFASRAVVELSAGTLASQVVASLAGSPGVPALPYGKLRVATNKVSAAPAGSKHLVLAAQGRGKLVGTLIDMRGTKLASSSIKGPFNFLEGDELITVDGVLRAHGTGTEDYFNAGWYFANGPSSAPFSAAITKSEDATKTFGQATAVRWHVPLDAVSYTSSLKFELEYGANAPSTMTDYRSVAFYYAQ